MSRAQSDERHAAMAGSSEASQAWASLLSDFDRRVDLAVEAHVSDESGKIMKAWSGFDKAGDYPVMLEAVHRKLEAKGASADLLDDRLPHLASIPDGQLPDLAARMRDARASRSPDDRDFIRSQRLYVTKEDLSAALATKLGEVGPSPIGTMLSALGDDVAFHVPARVSKEGRETVLPQTFKGAEALTRLHAGFGKGALRSIDVPLNPVHSIVQCKLMDPFIATAFGKAVREGWDDAKSRMIGIVVADHLKSLAPAKAPKAKDAPGASR